jgi:hypothetical protein
VLHELRNTKPAITNIAVPGVKDANGLFSASELTDALCAPLYTGNTDVYNIDLGSVAVTNPRSIILAMSNPNPVLVGLFLEQANADLCVCKGPVWPMPESGHGSGSGSGSGKASVSASTTPRSGGSAAFDADQAQIALEQMSNVAPHTFESASESSDCMCRLLQAEPEGSNSSGTAPLQLSSGQNNYVLLEIKPRFNHIFSFVFSSRFPPTLDRTRYLFHAHKEMNFLFSSPVQRLLVNVHYQLVPGKVQLAVNQRSLQWMIGLQNAIVVNGQSTLRRRAGTDFNEGFYNNTFNPKISDPKNGNASSDEVEEDEDTGAQAVGSALELFDIGLQIYSINTSTHPHRFQIFNTEPSVVSASSHGTGASKQHHAGGSLSTASGSSSNNGGAGGGGSKEAVTWMSELTPVEMCATFALVGDLPTDSVESFALVNSGVRWNNLYSCISQLLFGYNKPELKQLQQRAVEIVRLLYLQQFRQAHAQIIGLRKEWQTTANAISRSQQSSGAGSESTSSPRVVMTKNGGIPLSSFALQTKTKHTEISVNVDGIVVHTPLTFIPESYLISLPPITSDQVCVFFVEIYNPYAFPVGFSLANSIRSSNAANSNSEDSSSNAGGDGVNSGNGFFYIADDEAAAELWASLLIPELVEQRLRQTRASALDVDPDLVQTEITDLLYEIDNYHSIVDSQTRSVSAAWAMSPTPSTPASTRRSKRQTDDKGDKGPSSGNSKTGSGQAPTSRMHANSQSPPQADGEGRVHRPSRFSTHQPKPGGQPTAQPSAHATQPPQTHSTEGSIVGANSAPSPFPTIGGFGFFSGGSGDGSSAADIDPSASASSSSSSSTRSHGTGQRSASVSNSLLEQSIANMLGDVGGQYKSLEQGHKRPEFASVMQANVRRVQLTSVSTQLIGTLMTNNLQHPVNHDFPVSALRDSGVFMVANFTLTKEFVAAANSEVKIGPILFIPPRTHRNPSSIEFVTPSSFDSAMFIRNNFTGVDKLELAVSTASTVVQFVSVCSEAQRPNASAALSADGSGVLMRQDQFVGSCNQSHKGPPVVPQQAPASGDTAQPASASPPPFPTELIVHDAATQARVTWANMGSVVGMVYDIRIDGRRCKDLVLDAEFSVAGNLQGNGMTISVAGNGPAPSSTPTAQPDQSQSQTPSHQHHQAQLVHQQYQTTGKHGSKASFVQSHALYTVPELCSQLPLSMVPSTQMSVQLPVLQSCSLSAQERHIELFLQPDLDDAGVGLGKGRQGRGARPSNVVSLKVLATLSPARMAECVGRSSLRSPAVDALFLFSAILVCVLTIVQISKLRTARAHVVKISSAVASKVVKKRKNHSNNPSLAVLGFSASLSGSGSTAAALNGNVNVNVNAGVNPVGGSSTNKRNPQGFQPADVPGPSRTHKKSGHSGDGSSLGSYDLADNPSAMNGAEGVALDTRLLDLDALVAGLNSSQRAVGPESNILSHVHQLRQRRHHGMASTGADGGSRADLRPPTAAAEAASQKAMPSQSVPQAAQQTKKDRDKDRDKDKDKDKNKEKKKAASAKNLRGDEASQAQLALAGAAAAQNGSAHSLEPHPHPHPINSAAERPDKADKDSRPNSKVAAGRPRPESKSSGGQPVAGIQTADPTVLPAATAKTIRSSAEKDKEAGQASPGSRGSARNPDSAAKDASSASTGGFILPPDLAQLGDSASASIMSGGTYGGLGGAFADSGDSMGWSGAGAGPGSFLNRSFFVSGSTESTDPLSTVASLAVSSDTSLFDSLQFSSLVAVSADPSVETARTGLGVPPLPLGVSGSLFASDPVLSPTSPSSPPPGFGAPSMESSSVSSSMSMSMSMSTDPTTPSRTPSSLQTTPSQKTGYSKSPGRAFEQPLESHGGYQAPSSLAFPSASSQYDGLLMDAIRPVRGSKSTDEDDEEGTNDLFSALLHTSLSGLFTPGQQGQAGDSLSAARFPHSSQLSANNPPGTSSLFNRFSVGGGIGIGGSMGGVGGVGGLGVSSNGLGSAAPPQTGLNVGQGAQTTPARSRIGGAAVGVGATGGAMDLGLGGLKGMGGLGSLGLGMLGSDYFAGEVRDTSLLVTPPPGLQSGERGAGAGAGAVIGVGVGVGGAGQRAHGGANESLLQSMLLSSPLDSTAFDSGAGQSDWRSSLLSSVSPPESKSARSSQGVAGSQLRSTMFDGSGMDDFGSLGFDIGSVADIVDGSTSGAAAGAKK